MPESSAGNFVRDLIVADNASRKYGGRVATRFPPEPNGYLHIGHAKAIWVDFGLATEFGGSCNLRFDDTNPTTEDVEYVEAIQEDIRWLGFRWDGLHYASDYFEELYQLAEKLVDLDDALVTWRHKHVLTVERIIGGRPGTGGTDGVGYLARTLQRRCFPELWSLRTKL